jgi:hypothetical protein
MFTMTKRLIYSIALITMMAGLNACSKSDKTTTPVDETLPAYGIWLQLGSWPNTTQYIVGASSLTEGTVNLTGNGVEVTSKADYGIIPHKGFYYYPSTSSTRARFSKFRLHNNQLETVKEVPFTYQTGISSYTWANDTTLVLIGTNGDGTKVLYSVVNSNTLAITNGELAISAIPAGYAAVSVRDVNYVNSKLYLGLAYTAVWPAPAYPKAVMAIYDYPSLTKVTQIEDDRSVGLGGINMWMSGSSIATNGDLYVLSTPGWMSESLPSAVYRIKNNTTVLDPTYFFNINTSSLGGEAVALWGLGNGQAIVKYEDPTVTNDNSDAGFIYSYAVIDLAAGTVVKKLSDIPLDKGETLETVLVESGKAYIMANSQSGKDYVWVYDAAAGTIKPGLEIIGGYDYMLRIDNLK